MSNIAVRRPCSRSWAVALLFGLFLLAGKPASAQQPESYAAERQRAFDLLKESKFDQASPLLDKLAKEKPDDAEVIFYQGFTCFWQAKLESDPARRKQIRAHGYLLLQKAKELGLDTPLLQSMLKDLPPDGGDEPSYSKNAEANQAMVEAEADFAKGDLEGALARYSRALELEPHLYEAALFAGDACFKQGQQDKAGEFFQRAVAIDPNREIAYRYWGDALASQGKTAEARDKFIESFISEPYNKLARAGLVEWANKNGAQITHPEIDIPASVSSEGKDKMTITLDPNVVSGKKRDGSSAWMIYGIARTTWVDRAFAKHFPNEKTYRHSLAEELAALTLVAIAAEG
ncbi:MAG TPA: tetratricopeptide repeat protein, partial [Blastocatellia bacterium]|nr:tetratricopeptide repeat protein [Blastocatellia bacterium]